MQGHRGRNMFLTDEEKQNTPKVTKELLLRVFSYLKPYWRQLVLVFACIIVASVCSLFPSILTGNIIDVLTGKNLGGWIGEGISALDRTAYFIRYAQPDVPASAEDEPALFHISQPGGYHYPDDKRHLRR